MKERLLRLKNWRYTSTYAVAASLGCAYIDRGNKPHETRPDVLMGEFSNGDRTKTVWVGFDHKTKVFIIQENETCS